MVVESNDITTILSWYWRYCLSTHSRFENVIARIDQLALLTRIASESSPSDLNSEEVCVVNSWLAADCTVAGEFSYLPETDKELIRKICRARYEDEKRALLFASNALINKKRSSSTAPNGQKTEASQLWLWKRCVGAVKWVLRFWK